QSLPDALTGDRHLRAGRGDRRAAHDFLGRHRARPVRLARQRHAVQRPARALQARRRPQGKRRRATPDRLASHHHERPFLLHVYEILVRRRRAQILQPLRKLHQLHERAGQYPDAAPGVASAFAVLSMAKSEQNLPRIDYAPPPARGSRRFAWPVFISSAMMVAYLELLALVLVPHMKSLYADFHLELPASTQIVLSLSDMMLPFGCLILAAVPFALAVLVPRLWPAPETLEDSAAIARKTRRVARLIYFVMFFLILAVMYALLSPMVSLIRGLT